MKVKVELTRVMRSSSSIKAPKDAPIKAVKVETKPKTKVEKPAAAKAP